MQACFPRFVQVACVKESKEHLEVRRQTQAAGIRFVRSALELALTYGRLAETCFLVGYDAQGQVNLANAVRAQNIACRYFDGLPYTAGADIRKLKALSAAVQSVIARQAQ